MILNWYNIVGASGLLISIVVISMLTIIHRQYRTGKRGEAASFMMLASCSVMVGMGFDSFLSLGFYLLSFAFSIVALIIGMKAIKIRSMN